MLVRLWMVLSVSTQVWTQQSETDIGGSRYEWGWNLQRPSGESTSTSGQYYVRLPQSEQRVRYSADGSGYHGAVAINTSGEHHRHAVTFALGQQALDLLADQQTSLQQPHNVAPIDNSTNSLSQPIQQDGRPQYDIYLLQQQFTGPQEHQQIVFTPEQQQIQPNQQIVQIIPNNFVQNDPTSNIAENLPTPAQYVIHNAKPPVQETVQSYYINRDADDTRRDTAKNDRSNPLDKKEDFTEQNHFKTPVVQVFKDANCTDNEESENVAQQKYDFNPSTERTFTQSTSYNSVNINGNFGAKVTDAPLTYKGAVHYSVEVPKDRQNSRSERYYFLQSTTPNVNFTEDGISRLVAVTQDLISNDDLLTINHAAEKPGVIYNDDVIKPKHRFSVRHQQKNGLIVPNHSNQFTVKTKLANILETEIDHSEQNESKEQVLQSSANEYKFVSPIIVQDTTANDFKEQVVNNFISTVVPYIDDKYEVTDVRGSAESNEEINLTPRPIGQKYLAPITVALRLLNANDSNLYNSLEDYEGSDSEIVIDTVSNPKTEKTIVEIQKSIPGETIHINEVEYHKEYLEDGRANNNKNEVFDSTVKSLFSQYVEALESSSKIQKNTNENLYKYGTMKDYNSIESDSGKNSIQENIKDNVEPSGSIQTEVEVRPGDNSSNQRKEYVRDYSNYNNNVIQPIIIEKEVPITKFVDRFIEKKVPYPEPVEVVKEVPVDNPILLPFPVEKIVNRPYEVTRFVDKPYPIAVPKPYPVKVPYPVENKVFVDRPVHVPYPVEKIVENNIIHPVPIPTPVAVPFEVQQQVLYPVPIERQVPVHIETVVERKVPVPYPVDRPYPVHYETKVPVPYPVEKRVPVTVEKIVEKPVTVTQYVDKPYPVPIHYPQPYPVDRYIEKKVPYYVEKKVPYPVEKIVEKIVEKPVVVTKYIDKPYPVEKRVPYAVEKIVEKKVPYAVEVKVPYEKFVEKPVHVPYAVEKIVEKPIMFLSYLPRYLPDQHKQGISQQHLQNLQNNYLAQYYQMIKDNQKRELKPNPPIQNIHWGNQYASSYVYKNHTLKTEPKSSELLSKYIEYVKSNPNAQSSVYIGPPPERVSNDYWRSGKDFLHELKLRRTDRNPKSLQSNLRIEYGGFKPPLIPSTQVDLDGIPVDKKEA